MKRLGSLAVETFHDIIPEDGLPEQASGDLRRDQRRHEPIAAHDFVDAAGPLLPYQKAADKDVFGELTFPLGDEVAGEAINSLARFSHGLDEDHRLLLSADANQIFGSGGDLNEHGRVKAAEALVRLERHGHLASLDRHVMVQAVMKRPELGRLLEERRRVVESENGHASSPVANGQARGGNPPLSLDEHIDRLEKQRHAAKTALVYTEQGRLDLRQSIAEEIPKLSKDARADLMASFRDDRVR